MTDASMTILSLNDLALKLLGYTRSQIIGQSVEILMPPTIARHHASYVQHYIETGEKRLIGKPRKQNIVRSDGTMQAVWLNLGEIPATATDPLRFLGRLLVDTGDLPLTLLDSERSTITTTGDGTTSPTTTTTAAAAASTTATATATATTPPPVANTSTAEVTSLANSLASIMEVALKNAQLEMTKQANEELSKVDRALHKSRQQLMMSDSNHKARRNFSSASIAPTFSASTSSLFPNDTDDEDLTDDTSHGKIAYENFEIHERIADGGGSGASVYRCSVDGWGCCMKEINITDTAGADLQGMLNEVTVLEQLPYHKNLVRYLFHRSTPSSVQIFMRHYSCNLAQELKRRVANQEPMFSVTEVARLALDIASGMAVLHARKLLHRYATTRRSCNCLVYLLGVLAWCTCLVYLLGVPAWCTCLVYLLGVLAWCTCLF
jgi:PAS domain S-box-containing protein